MFLLYHQGWGRCENRKKQKKVGLLIKTEWEKRQFGCKLKDKNEKLSKIPRDIWRHYTWGGGRRSPNIDIQRVNWSVKRCELKTRIGPFQLFLPCRVCSSIWHHQSTNHCLGPQKDLHFFKWSAHEGTSSFCWSRVVSLRQRMRPVCVCVCIFSCL